MTSYLSDLHRELYCQIETTFSDELNLETETSRNAMPHLLDKLLHTLVKSLHQIMFIKLNYSCGLILRHCPFLLAHFLFILDSVVYRWRSRSCYVEQEMCYVVARHERW